MNQQLISVFASRRIADVDPFRHESAAEDAGVFEDDLVGVEAPAGAHLLDDLDEPDHVVGTYVCGLAPHVLGARRAAHGFVELRTAVAAIDVDGLAELAAQRVEDVVHERVEVTHYFLVGLVLDAVVLSRIATA